MAFAGSRNSPRRAQPLELPLEDLSLFTARASHSREHRGAIATNAPSSSLSIANPDDALEEPEQAVVADGIPVPARPSLEGIRPRHSSSSWSNSTISRIKTGLASEQAQKKFMMIKNILAFIGLCTGIAASYGLYTGYVQTWYAKATFDQGVQAQQQGNQAQQQAMEWTAWQMKSQFYNDCLNLKGANTTTLSFECEGALAIGPPPLPFSYATNSTNTAVNKLRKRLANAICPCSCPKEPEPDHFIVSSPEQPSGFRTLLGMGRWYDDAGQISLPAISLLSILTLWAVVTLRRKGVFTKLTSKTRTINQIVSQSASEALRHPRQINSQADVAKASSAQARGTGAGSSTTIRRRGQGSKELRKGQTLWEAAATGNKNGVLDQLATGSFADINHVQKRYGTPLCAACEGGNLEIAMIFIKRGADVNAMGGRFCVPIQAAAYAGSTELVQLLLGLDARVDIPGGWTHSPLQAAAERGDNDMVLMILNAGASVNSGGGALGLPLQGAASKGKFDIVSLLLDNGAEINAEGGEYGNALNAAVSCGASEVVKLLLERGANVNGAPGLYGNCLQIALHQNFPALAKLLVEHGANGNVTDDQKRTPLIEAALLGDETLVKALLKGGSSINAQGKWRSFEPLKMSLTSIIDEDGWTALHYVALDGKEAIARMLVEDYGANGMLRDKFDAPPLHRATGNGHLSVMKLLLDNGADVNTRDCLGAAALHQSGAKPEPIVRLLLERGADPNAATNMGETPLHSAINANNEPIVRLLLEAGSDASLQDKDQATSLFRSIKNGYYGIAKVLLESSNADINARSSNALQEAIIHEREDLVNIMLEKGTSVNAQGNQHGSALQAACTTPSSLPLATLLLDAAANINITGGQHGCALSAAAFHGSPATVALLLRNGANPNIRGGRYGSPLRAAHKSLAAKEDKDEIIALLLSAGATTPEAEVVLHDEDVWRLTPAGWTWLPPENRRDITSAFGHESNVRD
ncbi:hypothetical protein MMC30_006263 [Trapelia coarctata]|nr:hypothetical protein [Trapelia coarctata]